MTDGVKKRPEPVTAVTGKKPYKSPALISWGNLKDLTLSAGKSSTAGDGGSKYGNKQTH